MLGYFNASQASCWCDAASLKTRGQLLLAEQCASSCEPGPWRTDTVFVRTKSRRRPTTSGCQGCVRDEHASQHGEDLLLLPMLLRASGVGQPGTFVELGALNGRLYSNTLLLERCLWVPLLLGRSDASIDKTGNPTARSYASAAPTPTTLYVACSMPVSGTHIASRHHGTKAARMLPSWKSSTDLCGSERDQRPIT